jgi:hypothetical protein
LTRRDVVTAARAWLGVPFRPKGRSHMGVDCLGLLVVLGQQFAVPHQDEQHYTDYPDPQRRMLATFDRYLERRPNEADWDATIGVFTTHRALPGHVALFTTRDHVRHLLHASMAERMVLEHPYDEIATLRQGRLLARYGFPGLT